MYKWYPKDVIAMVVIIVCGVLLCLGYNHLITYTFGAVIAAYIGFDIRLKGRR